MIPEMHREFIERAVTILKKDNRISGIALTGSYVTGQMDDYSDLDFMLAVEPGSFKQVLEDRTAIAEKLGDLLSSFPGDHIGVPDLLICLYDAPLIHADFNFIPLDKAGKRFNGTAILYDKDGVLTKNYQNIEPPHPALDRQWLEDRFWVWVHYAALKLRRGELFEALDMISYLRATVLGPLLHVQMGGSPRGVRRLETLAPAYLPELIETVPAYDKAACVKALLAEIGLYQKLRKPYEEAICLREKAEKRAIEFLLESADE